MTTEEGKTFINAVTPTISILYKMYAVLFVIAPLGMFYGYFQVLKIEEFRFTLPVLILTLLLGFVLAILTALLILFRNCMPHKVVINNKGVYYFSVFRKAYMRWDQIQAVKITRSLMGRGMFKLVSRGEVFNIPNTMKEMNTTYPKQSSVKNTWIYEDGTERQNIPENCPLFIEIQQYLSKFSVKTVSD
jgi:hypothetical protein